MTVDDAYMSAECKELPVVRDESAEQPATIQWVQPVRPSRHKNSMGQDMFWRVVHASNAYSGSVGQYYCDGNT